MSPSSCRRLTDVVTEFGAQAHGLDLDGVLLAWGTDMIREGQTWSIANARRYRRNHVKAPFRLRLNAYRVLLTRGRDVNLVFVPPMGVLDLTANYLVDCGFMSLT